jgi:hypothetical protein
MPIGPITPGAFVTVTPDSPLPGIYASVQAPTATMVVQGAHLQALTLVVLNVQDYLNEIKLDLAGGTMTGSLTLDNANVPVGKLLTVAGTLTTSGTVNLNGTTNIGNAASDVVTVTATATVAATATWEELGISLEKGPAYIGNADKTLDLSVTNAASQKAQEIVMNVAPTANRTITLRQAAHADTPPDGYWYVITVLLDASTNLVYIQREGSADYVAILGDAGNAGSNEVASVKVKKIGGVWRGVWIGGKYAIHGGEW